jgi:hypothetical protein
VADPALAPIRPEVLVCSETIMTRFMREPTTNFKTFAELVQIFGRDHEAILQEGDPSNDLRVLEFASMMMAGQWEGPIVFLRDHDGRIGDGVHRGIAYLRCINNGAGSSVLPELLLAPLGSWQWAAGLKERLEADAAATPSRRDL